MSGLVFFEACSQDILLKHSTFIRYLLLSCRLNLLVLLNLVVLIDKIYNKDLK